MKTTLPTKIETVEEAKNFLTDLCNNGESYHPDSSAFDIVWPNIVSPTIKEMKQLDCLMDMIMALDFDPYKTIFDLIHNEYYIS